MIKISNLKKRISENFEIQVENLSLKKETIIYFDGENGAGKTILFKILLGIIPFYKGSINKGKNTISGFLGISHMIDFLTPKEYFLIVGKSYGLNKQETLNRYNFLNEFFLKNYLDEKKKICDFSDGNKQLIGIIAACLPFSDYIILDEPFNFLDKENQLKLFNMLQALNTEKKISLLYTDNISYFEFEKSESVLVQNGKIKQVFKNSF